MHRIGWRQVTGIVFAALALVGCGSSRRPALPAAPASAIGGTVAAEATTGAAEPVSGSGATGAPAGTGAPAPIPVAESIQRLHGLAFGSFLAASYDVLLARSPEQVTALGVADRLGMRNDRLDDLSESYVRETRDLEQSVLAMLRGYDRAALSPDEQLSYDIYEWYLDDRGRGQRFADYDYPMTQCRLGRHARLVSLLTEAHPMNTPRDAEDYVSRLGQVDKQVSQLLAGVERRARAGVVLPRFIVARIQDVLTEYLGTASRDPAGIDPASLSVYTTFSEKVEGIAGLNDTQRASLRQRALAAIASSFVPAYLAELEYLDRVAGVATDDAGVWKFPDGDAYYAYRLRSQTTTDLTPEAVHDLGLREVARIQSELRTAFTELGYPQELELADLVKRAVEAAGFLPMATQADADAVIHAWEALVDEADERLGPAFGLKPAARVVVVGGLGGEFYAPASVDSSDPCEFHVGVAAPSQAKYMMRTIAYHEAVPGHHYQIGLARELDLPQLRREIPFTAFTEGWAVYAERLAWETGLYDGDPYGNIGRLLCDLLRAARLVTDTGIHARHWTRDQARDYMNRTVGSPPGTYDEEVDRFIVAPAVAIGNEVALLRILDLRDRARAALGDEFDLKGFHDAVIGHGSLPLEILDGVVDDYIGHATTGDG
jgi:uncharacterized protein (DUF885 family)